MKKKLTLLIVFLFVAFAGLSQRLDNSVYSFEGTSEKTITSITREIPDDAFVLMPGNWAEVVQPTSYYWSSEIGWVFGNNSYGATGAGAKFFAPEPYEVIGAYFWVRSLRSSNLEVLFGVYEFEDGVVGDLLTSASIAESDIWDLYPGGASPDDYVNAFYVTFDEPVTVYEEFFVGFDASSLPWAVLGDGICLVSGAIGTGGGGAGIAYILDSTGWGPATNWSPNLDIDLAVFPVAQDFLGGYNVTFEITDGNENSITEAAVTLGHVTNDPGNYVFEHRLPGSYSYAVYNPGYFRAYGDVVIEEADVTVQVTLVELPEIPIIMSIDPVDDIRVDFGATEAQAIAALLPTTTITDSNDDIHVVTLDWSIEGYNGDVSGDYFATGTFELPGGVEQSDPPLTLQVTTTVTVLEAPGLVEAFPWLEDFEGGLEGWTIFDEDGGGTIWQLGEGFSHGDGLSSVAHDYWAPTYQDGWLVSPKLILPNENMQLVFWSLNIFPAWYVKNSVLVSTGSIIPENNDWVEIWAATSVSEEDWTRTAVSLADYSGQEIFIAFRYEGKDADMWILDDVLVEVAPDDYLVTFHVSENVSGGVGIEGSLIAIEGYPELTTNAEGMATIQLIDGEYTADVSKEGYEPESVSFTVVGAPLDIVVALDDIKINPFNLGIDTIGLEPGQAAFLWNRVIMLLEDDFESYESFTLDLSPWTVYEETGVVTYNIANTTFPNQQLPFGYIIFDPTSTTPPLTNPMYNAFSGIKYAAHMAQTSGPDNSWLVSPQLSIIDGMEFQFMGRSVNSTYGLERFNVYVSTTGNVIEDFVKISQGDFIEAPTVWTKYFYDLSPYAGQDIYLAIQCVSNDAFLFMVDDVKVGLFAPEATKSFTEFNVYLDDMDTPLASVTGSEYLFTGLSAGQHTAGVQAVYTTGVSDIVTIDFEFGGFAVTFNVDMTYAEEFEPESDNVYLTGDLMGWAAPGDEPDDQTMSRVDESMVWSKTLHLLPGTYAYKYFLNAGWDGGEWQGGDDRALLVEGDMEVNDWFGSLTDPTHVPDQAQTGIRVYPVPAKTAIHITSPTLIRQVNIVDLLGQVVYAANGVGMNHQVNVSGFKDGMYFIQVVMNGKIETFRIQVLK